MDVNEFRRYHVPAFGSWNGSDDHAFSECFEATRQLNFYPYYGDRDLYVGGDLYGCDVVTPAVIVVPRRRTKSRYPNVTKAKKENWVNDVKEPPSTVMSHSPVKKANKPVDEDLYKISPELLYAKSKKKRGWGIFSSCLMPICAA